MHGAWLFVLSFLTFFIGFTVNHTFQWTNHWAGFQSGLVQGGFFALMWCAIYVLPWSLIIRGIYRRRQWQKFRTHWILAPSILIAAVLMGSLIIDPVSTHQRFSSFTKTTLPENAEDLNFQLTGGGVVDYSDIYYFRTTPSEVERLIRALDLEEVSPSADMQYTGLNPLRGSPDFTAWKGARKFEGSDETKVWYYHMITDSEGKQVYVHVGCI
jgi:hypothetical protein